MAFSLFSIIFGNQNKDSKNESEVYGSSSAIGMIAIEKALLKIDSLDAAERRILLEKFNYG